MAKTKANWDTVVQGTVELRIKGMGVARITSADAVPLSSYFIKAVQQIKKCSIGVTEIRAGWRVATFNEQTGVVAVLRAA